MLLLAATLMFSMGAFAQTTVSVNDSTMGYVETVPYMVCVGADTISTDIDTVPVYDTTIVNITYDTIMDTVYNPVFDYDSIVSIDSVFDPHGVFIGMDTTYLCTDTVMDVNPVYVSDTTFTFDTSFYVDTVYNIEYDSAWTYYNKYHAIAFPGYKFNYWTVAVTFNKYWSDIDSAYIDSVFTVNMTFDDVEIDTATNDTVYNNGWLPIVVPSLTDIWNDSVELPGIEAMSSIEITAYFDVDSNWTSINDVETYTYSIYPNPTAGIATISGNVKGFAVYDMNGRYVYTANGNVIDITNLSRGVYFVRITSTDSSVKTVKIVKQ